MSSRSAIPPSLATPWAASTTLQIPHLTREPKLEDFADMQPSPSVAGTMLKVDQFWQHDPIDGQPISQKTEAYLGYTDKNLYVVFLAFDNDAAHIRNHMVRREQINEEDQVGIFLDTFHDHRHCVFFFINPSGVQQEGTFFEGQQDIDLSWDTIWKSETRVLKNGWIGFISVPFKSLRFRRPKLCRNGASCSNATFRTTTPSILSSRTTR